MVFYYYKYWPNFHILSSNTQLLWHFTSQLSIFSTKGESSYVKFQKLKIEELHLKSKILEGKKKTQNGYI